MRRHGIIGRGTLLMPFVLALGLVACDGEDVEEDPREALSEAVTAFGDYEGIELTLGAQLDEAAEQAMVDEGATTEQVALISDSALTVRGVEGEGDAEGQSEFVLVVGDETVLTLRALAQYELYALIDLPAVERVAEGLGAGPAFEQGIAEFEQMAGLFGLGQVASAAREAEWIRVAGVDSLVEMAEEQVPEEEQPDEADLEALARDVGERLLAFLEDEDVEVTHVGSDDAGERIRVTAGGAQLRELAVDLLEALDEVGGVTDPTGMGMGTEQLRTELEEAISDDLEISFDAWVDGGELSQVAVDVFGLARAADAGDVPDGEFLIVAAIAEFSGPIEAPEADVTFDVFEVFGEMAEQFGQLGELGGEGAEELPDDPTGDGGEDFCLSEEELDEFLQQLPEEQRDLSDEELENMLGIPVC